MPTDRAHQEKLLIRLLSGGNEKAFEQLFDTYRNILYKYSYSMLGSKPHAEEIVQDVFLKVWQKRETLSPELSFKSYLFTITRNRIITFLKKAAKDQELREVIFYSSRKFTDSTDLHIRETEVEKIKKEALNLLPPRRRQIFEMSRYEGKSYEEIAKELGLSKNTVRNQMSMALETLRDFLLKHKHISIILFLFYKNWL
ncbi:RNA polymerase sigma factor [Sinomicrobium soli]|uniref:RNA polymerase sigma factor n=1 Tax=Sinomicrobium sp. N-1-3-6 TaxID=2219864 RepID=UPI000DCB8472|nr:RNA polymerase sigma-70 factor [Sinomicrobium sp. N-1-3-6]RAV29483.1 RNA polymerase sigma-70 factor [Sinomicrobium sp. N-1-3-6]